MPVGRKHATRASAKTHAICAPEDAAKLRSLPIVHVAATEDDVRPVVMPRHHAFPELPQPQGELFVECTVFLYTILALALQHVNLYKTFWWMPNSHTHHTLVRPQILASNYGFMTRFYLIDPFLVSVIGLILGRRVTVCFMKKVTFNIPGLNVPSYLHVFEWLMKFALVIVVLTSFMFSLSQVLISYSWISNLCLFYPFGIYCLFLSRRVFNFLKQTSLQQLALEAVHFFTFTGPPGGHSLASNAGHACSLNPHHIREEVDILYADAMARLRQSLTSCVVSAYYAIVVPCFFTPGTLYIDWLWVVELCSLIFLTSWIIQLAYALPMQYCDLLHRSAVHLGAWYKLEDGRQLAQPPPNSTWTETGLWCTGSVVKHGRTLYKGEGCSIAAEPGNADHSRFYIAQSLCLNRAMNKKILYPGKELPNFGDQFKLYFHYQAKLLDDNQTCVDDTRKPWPQGYGEPLELVLGKSFRLPIWEACLKSMRIGEVASFEIPPQDLLEYPMLSKQLRDIAHKKKHPHDEDHHQIGSGCCGGMLAKFGTGYPELDKLMQEPQKLCFTFELLRVIPPENYEAESWQLSKEQKLASVAKLKAEGNSLVQEAKFGEAMVIYGEAISRVEASLVLERPGDEDYADLVNLKLPLLANYALCQLKSADFYGAIRTCSDILEKDASNEKALFRRAQAHAKVFNFDDAKADYARFVELNPDQSQLVAKELALLEQAKRCHKDSQRQVFQQMMQSSTDA